MKEAGLQAVYPKPRTSKKNFAHRTYPCHLQNLKLEHSNQVWATDITYIKLPQGFVYLIAVLDVYSRYIISWRLSNSLSLPFCLEALNEALEQGIPEIFNTDQGAQFTSDEWIYTLVNWGIQPSMTGVGRCLDNIHCERFWRTLKYEDIYIYGYSNVTEARQRIGKFIEFYNHQRPHQSLGYKTPGEVYKTSLEERQPNGYVENSLNLKIEFPTYPQALCLTNNQRSQISLI
jgi:putative transposase